MKINAIAQRISILVALLVMVVSLLARKPLEKALIAMIGTWVIVSMIMYVVTIVTGRIATDLLIKEKEEREAEEKRLQEMEESSKQGEAVTGG